MRILVAGDHADNLGYQCGGWTITWQGGSGNTTIGTTILQGMRGVAPNDTIDYSVDGNFANTMASYSVVVIGEKSYAEGNGDRKDLELTESDINLVKKMKSYGNPVVVILISGRPLIIEKILPYSDAIIAAWLPGTEGEGISDVLFGDYTPRGVLSHSWPKSMEQIPINYGSKDYNPLYKYGYGITSFQNSSKDSDTVSYDIPTYEKQDDGIILKIKQEDSDPRLIKVQICNDDIIRIVASPVDSFSSRASLMVNKTVWKPVEWSVTEEGSLIKISTAKVIVTVDPLTGAITFYNSDNHLLLEEKSEVEKSFHPLK